MWDKQVFEREKFTVDDSRARKLLVWESEIYRGVDLLLADTGPHARFFTERFGVDGDKTMVVPVGAEEELFYPRQHAERRDQPEVLFYGSFIGLQGATIIAAAASLTDAARFVFLGEGPDLSACKELTKGLEHVSYEPWIGYRDLPERLAYADILLGVFGLSDKAGRVVPNKVYQALACGRPVITRESDAYPEGLLPLSGGLRFVPPGSPEALAQIIDEHCAGGREQLRGLGQEARAIYERYFGKSIVKASLEVVTQALFASEKG
jgi:glycosyltransferase involved in cell wall biosynthesis